MDAEDAETAGCFGLGPSKLWLIAESGAGGAGLRPERERERASNPCRLTSRTALAPAVGP